MIISKQFTRLYGIIIFIRARWNWNWTVCDSTKDWRHWRHCYNNIMDKMPNACDNNMRKTLSFRNSSHFFLYYNNLPKKAKKLFIVFIFLIFSLGVRFIAEMDILCITHIFFMCFYFAILDNQLHFFVWMYLVFYSKISGSLCCRHFKELGWFLKELTYA